MQKMNNLSTNYRVPLSKAVLPDNSLLSAAQSNITDFEILLQQFLGKDKKVVALNSGTAAIHMALMLSGISKKDTVICQSFTFSASANPIIYQGATPIFVDSEEDNWGMSPDYLELAIQKEIKKGKKPAAIIFVHTYGMPAKINQIVQIAKQYNITLIEDAAEALGSEYNGQKCGTFGDYGVLSFNNNKIITTYGGGALICKSDAEQERALFLATQAKDDVAHYQHSVIGYNYRMSAVLAGIGCAQMKTLSSFIKKRRDNHFYYQKKISNIKGITVFSEPKTIHTSNHWLTCILVDEKVSGFSNIDLKKAFEIMKIESRLLWNPMHLQPVFKNTLFYGGVSSEKLFKKGLSIPSSSNLTEKELQLVTEVIKNM